MRVRLRGRHHRRWRAVERVGSRPDDPLRPEAARGVLDEADHTDAQILTPGDPAWPARLDGRIAVAPLAVWAVGDLSRLGADPGRLAIAVVGSTNPSFAGSIAATRLAADLTAEGYGVITGGTEGVGSAAIEGTVAANGAPLAVLPGRSTRPWADNDETVLTERSGGVIVAELAQDDGDASAQQASRDRLLLPLADVVVLIEVPLRDPNLETIRSAVRSDMAAGVVPFGAGRAAAAGGARLLDDGLATRVDGADDVHDLLDDSGNPAWSGHAEARAHAARDAFAR